MLLLYIDVNVQHLIWVLSTANEQVEQRSVWIMISSSIIYSLMQRAKWLNLYQIQSISTFVYASMNTTLKYLFIRCSLSALIVYRHWLSIDWTTNMELGLYKLVLWKSKLILFAWLWNEPFFILSLIQESIGSQTLVIFAWSHIFCYRLYILDRVVYELIYGE